VRNNRYYGDTLAETVLGRALKSIPIPREDYVLSTKCGRYGSGFDFSAERVTKSVDESLQRLNVTYVDLIHCHDIEFGSLDQAKIYSLCSIFAAAFFAFGDLEHLQQCGVCDLAKIFPTSKFSYLLFSNPTCKLLLGLLIGGRLLIANHLGQSLELVNQKTGSKSQIIFITLFSSRC
jgi:hypothetical protein